MLFAISMFAGHKNRSQHSKMGGSIKVESKLNEGSTFTIYLLKVPKKVLD